MSQKTDKPRRTQSLDTRNRVRSKNYSWVECDILMKICDKYISIINKNSSRDKDKIEKSKTWAKITKEYNLDCRAEGIVSSKYLSLVKFFSIFHIKYIARFSIIVVRSRLWAFTNEI